MTYTPKPVETSQVELTPAILDLTERLAENAHDIWAQQRIADGWQHGLQRDDARKTHPCLVPYSQLPESEKAYDRQMSLATLKAIIALGYHITNA